jgi:hypothetical protein
VKIDRRRLLQALGMSPALLAGSAEASQKKTKQKTTSHSASKLVGLNPKGMPPEITLFPLAPRFSSLEGKTIYMVDIGFNNGDVFFQEMQRWFKENMPSVKTIYRRKIGAYPQDDPDLWKEIKAAGAAVIMGVGH